MGTSGNQWVKEVRGLPSNPASQDYLKTDYIEVNLNNSRKLIGNLLNLNDSSVQAISQLTEINDSLLRLHAVKNELTWLSEL